MDDVSAASHADDLRKTPEPHCPTIFNCFAAGMLVATAEGLLPIEQIQIGDQVYAYDDATGEEHLAEVVSLHQRDIEATWLLEIGGETIETTDEHPFYVAGQGWTEAKDLQAGHLLVAEGGDRLPLDKVERVEGNARVYNFEVRDLHSYFVGTVGAGARDHYCAPSCASRTANRTRIAGIWIHGEFKDAYQDLLAAGVSKEQARRAMRKAYKYFKSLNALP